MKKRSPAKKSPSKAKKSPSKAKKPPSKAEKSTRAAVLEAAQCPQPPSGTVRSEVIFIIEGLTAARPVIVTAKLNALGLDQQPLTTCLNGHFFVPPRGIPYGTFNGSTRVSQVIGTVHHELAAQGADRP